MVAALLVGAARHEWRFGGGAAVLRRCGRVERSMVELRGSAVALWRWRGRRAEVALLVGTLMAEA